MTWEQRVLAGDPKYPGTQWIPDFPYARYAELVGLQRDPLRRRRRRSAHAWDEALAADRPVVLEVKSSTREIPPLPPHITLRAGEEDGEGDGEGRPGARRA